MTVYLQTANNILSVLESLGNAITIYFDLADKSDTETD